MVETGTWFGISNSSTTAWKNRSGEKTIDSHLWLEDADSCRCHLQSAWWVSGGPRSPENSAHPESLTKSTMPAPFCDSRKRISEPFDEEIREECGCCVQVEWKQERLNSHLGKTRQLPGLSCLNSDVLRHRGTELSTWESTLHWREHLGDLSKL